MQRFTDQFMCEFKPTPAEVTAAAERYVAESEAYDRTVCTGPIIRGEIMPATPRECALISRYANQLFKRLVAENAGHFSSDELKQELHRIERARQ